MRKKTTIRHGNKLIEAALFTFMLLILSLAGCFSSKPKNIEAFTRPNEVNVTAEKYILQPPDEIEVRCNAFPEIHLQRQRIRPDGKVSFEGIGEIDAAGKTPSQLAEIIKEEAVNLYTLVGDNPIDVRVVKYESKVYYVLGQVSRPGPKDYTGRETVLDAVADAGLVPRSWEQRIQVIRPSSDKKVKPKIFEINLDRLMAHGDASKNVLLQEGDIVFVPATVFGAIGLMLEEVLAPVNTTFNTVNMVTGAPTPR